MGCAWGRMSLRRPRGPGGEKWGSWERIWEREREREWERERRLGAGAETRERETRERLGVRIVAGGWV